MPWSPSQASAKSKKANTPKKKRMWSDVADSVLAKTGDEARAIKTANGVIKKRSKKRKKK